MSFDGQTVDWSLASPLVQGSQDLTTRRHFSPYPSTKRDSLSPTLYHRLFSNTANGKTQILYALRR